MKYAVQAVILNEEGYVLAVSRKDDHNDFGLAGGKVDEEDHQHGLYGPLHAAIIREVKEETGLTIKAEDLTQIFSMHRDGYMGYTYLVKEWSGEISTDEPHAIKWVPFWRVTKGTFGYWNSMVRDSLNSMGVEYYNGDEIQEMKDELKEYIGSTIRKGYIEPFEFISLGIGPACTYVYITGSGSLDGEWDERDEEYDAGIEAIGKKYGQRLRFPSYYYTK